MDVLEIVDGFNKVANPLVGIPKISVAHTLGKMPNFRADISICPRSMFMPVKRETIDYSFRQRPRS